MHMSFLRLTFSLIIILSIVSSCCKKPTTVSYPLVFMTDFSEKDGAVSAMKGVAFQVSKDLKISDLTHEIPPFDIWQAAYRLKQTTEYWPPSVFVTVVDPGVGSKRKSVVVKTKSGHLFVGPDNGYLTLVSEIDPVIQARNLDESLMRLKGSEKSYTFHGRDLYAYVGARLASGQLKFEDTGDILQTPLVKLSYQKPTFKDNTLKGNIPILDPNYGNVWTNIPQTLLKTSFPQAKELKVIIKQKDKVIYQSTLPLSSTFSDVKQGEPLLYFNSLLQLSLALNQGNFALKHQIKSGPDWSILITE